MTNRFKMTALAASLLLSACANEQDSAGNVAGQANNVVSEAAPLPELPVITATKKYRCKGNDVVQIDWLELNGSPAQANVRVGDATVPTVLAAATDGSGYSSPEGAKLTGTKDAASVNLTLPGTGERSCKA